MDPFEGENNDFGDVKEEEEVPKQNGQNGEQEGEQLQEEEIGEMGTNNQEINSIPLDVGPVPGEGISPSRSPIMMSQREEPETIKIWREKQKQVLEEKDQREEEKMGELREQAKKEIVDW